MTARLLLRLTQSVSTLRLLDETYLQDLANLGLALSGNGDGSLRCTVTYIYIYTEKDRKLHSQLKTT